MDRFALPLCAALLLSSSLVPHRALMAQIGFVQGRPNADHPAFLQAAVERVRAMPGVEEAAYAAAVPLTFYSGSSNGLTATICRSF